MTPEPTLLHRGAPLASAAAQRALLDELELVVDKPLDARSPWGIIQTLY